MNNKLKLHIVGFILASTQAYAGNGDLIVNGNVGIGTNNPTSKLDIRGITQITDDGAAPDTASYGSFGVTRGNAAQNNSYISLTKAGAMVWGIGIDASSSFIIGPPSWSTKTIPTPYFTLKSSSGNVGIGTTNPGTYKLYVSGTSYSTGGWQGSDIKFKKDLQPINDSLSKVLKLDGVSYEWKTDEFKEKGFPDGRHYGVIAQEIEKVLPEVVKDAPDGSKSVAYTEIIPVLIEAIKEQQKQIGELRRMIKYLNDKD